MREREFIHMSGQEEFSPTFSLSLFLSHSHTRFLYLSFTRIEANSQTLSLFLSRSRTRNILRHFRTRENEQCVGVRANVSVWESERV